jgi:hypothetical protein
VISSAIALPCAVEPLERSVPVAQVNPAESKVSACVTAVLPAGADAPSLEESGAPSADPGALAPSPASALPDPAGAPAGDTVPVIVLSVVVLLLSSVPHAATVTITAAAIAAARRVVRRAVGAVKIPLTVVLSLPRAAPGGAGAALARHDADARQPRWPDGRVKVNGW